MFTCVAKIFVFRYCSVLFIYFCFFLSSAFSLIRHWTSCQQSNRPIVVPCHLLFIVWCDTVVTCTRFSSQEIFILIVSYWFDYSFVHNWRDGHTKKESAVDCSLLISLTMMFCAFWHNRAPGLRIIPSRMCAKRRPGSGFLFCSPEGLLSALRKKCEKRWDELHKGAIAIRCACVRCAGEGFGLEVTTAADDCQWSERFLLKMAKEIDCCCSGFVVSAIVFFSFLFFLHTFWD